MGRPEPYRSTGRRIGRSIRRASLVLGACAVTLACGGGSGSAGEGPSPATGDTLARTSAQTAGSLARSAPEEIRYDIENLGYEIADLENLIESGAVTAPGPEATRRLAEARAAYEEALDAASRDDTSGAADRLAVTAENVEAVKRALGLAEEWGEPFGAESIPVSVPEDVTS